jgi:hypothetical protein
VSSVDIDIVVLVAAVAAPCVVALIGWLTGGGRSRHDENLSNKRRKVVLTSIGAGALVAALVAPSIAVFWVVLALNVVLGVRENVPFSTYSMFSMPSRTAYALRFEDHDGELVPIAMMGLAPHVMLKRFAAEQRAARRRGVRDVDAVRRDAASVLATLVEESRPSGGPLARKPIAIVLVEYSLESGRVRQTKTPLMETSP